MPQPVIVVEVLSNSTARKDRTVKLGGYFAGPSIEHYLIVNWEEREIGDYRRDRRRAGKACEKATCFSIARLAPRVRGHFRRLIVRNAPRSREKSEHAKDIPQRARTSAIDHEERKRLMR